MIPRHRPPTTPGVILHEEFLVPLRMTQKALADHLGCDVKVVNRIVNGRTSAPDAPVTTELNGPSCSGRIGGSDVVKRMVKAGDIVIIPAGVPHGWAQIDDHVVNPSACTAHQFGFRRGG